jgi:hypothetical protein
MTLPATTCTDSYRLILREESKHLKISIKAYDSNHAQAQATDISRSINASSYELGYEKQKVSPLSELFEKLAFNLFTYNTCTEWEGKFSNKAPCVYIFGRRLFLKNLILRYLDIPTDSNVKLTCNCTCCINPYHFAYLFGKNSKLSCGDTKLLLAYRSQGTGINQIADALNVHRSTIYRKLKNERFSSGFTSNS